LEEGIGNWALGISNAVKFWRVGLEFKRNQALENAALNLNGTL
jgi:hypothetical protein